MERAHPGTESALTRTSGTVVLDDDAYATFKDPSEIAFKAPIRVPTTQLVQTMINAEMSRLNPRKIAQRFLKCILQQIGGPAGTVFDDEDEHMPEIPSAAAALRIAFASPLA